MSKPVAYLVKRKRQWFPVPVSRLTVVEIGTVLDELENPAQLNRRVARIQRQMKLSESDAADKLRQFGRSIALAFLELTPAGYVVQGVSVELQIDALLGELENRLERWGYGALIAERGAPRSPAKLGGRA